MLKGSGYRYFFFACSKDDFIHEAPVSAGKQQVKLYFTDPALFDKVLIDIRSVRDDRPA